MPSYQSPAEVAAARLQASIKAAMAAGASGEKATAFALVKELYGTWQGPVETLGRAGRAFEGLEALLGGDDFDLQVRQRDDGVPCRFRAAAHAWQLWPVGCQGCLGLPYNAAQRLIRVVASCTSCNQPSCHATLHRAF